MFILIMVIILGTCSAILSSIYFNTVAIQNTYGSVNTYYGAYYGAISSIERGLLMTKIKYPTYQGSGGFIGDRPVGAKSNVFPGNFWRLNNTNNTMVRTINSSTNHIVGTIDNKTLRTFSFENYTDPNPSDYNNNAITKSYYGIKEGLQFSGQITPYTGGNNSIRSTGMMDFNRFFNMRNNKYIIRGLHRGNSQAYERVGSLTGFFNFGTLYGKYSKNPWPTTTGEWNISD